MYKRDMETRKKKNKNKKEIRDQEIKCEKHFKQIKKGEKSHKRGLLDFLDIHACAGSGFDHTVNQLKSSESRDPLPYVPSRKSMPLSSYDDGECYSQISTFEIKREDILVKTEKKLSKKSKKNKESDTIKSQNNFCGVKMESRNGTPTKKVISAKDKKRKDSSKYSDILPQQSTESLLSNFCDESETLKSFKQSSLGLSTMAFSRPKDKVKQNSSGENKNNVFANLTNNCQVIPCRENESESDIQERLVATEDNLFEKDLTSFYKQRHAENNKFEIKKNVFCLFDCNKFPLTNGKGEIMDNASGQTMVVYKNGLPYCDLFGREIFDKYRVSSKSKSFKPFNEPAKNNKIVSKIPLYDFRGYPLTDFNGSSLINADGIDLIRTNKYGMLLSDINENPLFDISGIPVTKKGKSWLNPTGSPFRVFDKLQYPLTDKDGTVLTTRTNMELLKCDQFGRPIIDYNNEQVRDSNNNTPENEDFNPEASHENDSENVIVILGNIPIRIFDKENFPLTDENGFVLKDANGNYLLHIEKKDFTERKSSSNRKKEFIDLKNDSSYTGSYGTTVMSVKNSSMSESSNRTVIRKRKSDLDKPIKDINGEYVFDGKGQQLFSETIIKKRTEIFAENVTQDDQMSEFSGQESLETLSSTFTIEFDTEKDIYGRPLYSKTGMPLFDKYGRPIYDIYQRPLYNQEGVPIANANGVRLAEGSLEDPGVQPSFKVKNLEAMGFREAKKLKDPWGGPVVDSQGDPLYNKYGKPLKDAFGRPLYDSNGNPLSNEDGLPASEEVKKKQLKIIDVEDQFKKLAVSSSPEGPSRQNDDKSSQTYIARLRITTFINGEKGMELLEMAPS